jgi:predicted RNA binding protein YcfA (HicA-like mRNA interferase family)
VARKAAYPKVTPDFKFCTRPEPMPRKIRQLIRDLEKAGFVLRSGKGFHRKFYHPKLPAPVVISGQSGDDAKPYQERDVKDALRSIQP